MAINKMSLEHGWRYLRVMQEHYFKANHKDKVTLLSQIEAACGYRRDYLIARMNSPDLSRHERRRERTRTYAADGRRPYA